MTTCLIRSTSKLCIRLMNFNWENFGAADVVCFVVIQIDLPSDGISQQIRMTYTETPGNLYRNSIMSSGFRELQRILMCFFVLLLLSNCMKYGRNVCINCNVFDKSFETLIYVILCYVCIL